MKKLLAILVLCFSAFFIAPSDGFSQHRGYGGHGGYPGGGYYDGHRSHYGSYYGSYRGHHHNDAFFWGATGFLFGTALGAALYPPPVHYYNPPVYYSQPRMCRYERYVTDQWGRTHVEYFAAPCR